MKVLLYSSIASRNMILFSSFFNISTAASPPYPSHHFTSHNTITHNINMWYLCSSGNQQHCHGYSLIPTCIHQCRHPLLTKKKTIISRMHIFCVHLWKHVNLSFNIPFYSCRWYWLHCWVTTEPHQLPFDLLSTSRQSLQPKEKHKMKKKIKSTRLY